MLGSGFMANKAITPIIITTPAVIILTFSTTSGSRAQSSPLARMGTSAISFFLCTFCKAGARREWSALTWEAFCQVPFYIYGRFFYKDILTFRQRKIVNLFDLLFMC